VAEELDADWSQVKVEGAPADAKRYNNLFWGPACRAPAAAPPSPIRGTRCASAGATARAMLVSAAAEQWNVPAAEISVRRACVARRQRRKAGFGELAEAAAAGRAGRGQPEGPEGLHADRPHAPRKDSVSKTNGSAQFTQDVQLPGMLVAVVAHPPRFGGKLQVLRRQGKARPSRA
jgi:isoquinoline 1-oxidoreductase beta subunit